MDKNISNKVSIVLMLLVLLTGCKSRKETIKQPASKIIDHSKSDRLNAIHAAEINFNTLAIKAKADLTVDNNQHDVTMNIRIQKDQIIWVSITAFAGLEVARALITPDSIKILNRLENTYASRPFSFIHQFTNKEIGFQTFQSILVGNAVSEWIGDTTKMSIDGGKTKLSGGGKSLTCNYQFNEWNRPVQANLIGENVAQSLLIHYADFAIISGKNISQSVNMQSRVEDKYIQLGLHYAKVSIDEALDFPFVVPKRFSVKN